MKKILLLAFFAVFAGFASSAVIEWESIDCTSLQYNGTPLAQASIQLPSDIAQMLNGERINLNVSFASGSSRAVSGNVSNGILSEISCNPRPDATLTIFMESDALDRLSSSATPVKDFKALKAEGKIRFESRALMTSVKLFFADIYLFFQ